MFVQGVCQRWGWGLKVEGSGVLTAALPYDPFEEVGIRISAEQYDCQPSPTSPQDDKMGCDRFCVGAGKGSSPWRVSLRSEGNSMAHISESGIRPF